MESATLEDVIRRYVHLSSVPAGTGWFPVLCKVCNDHGRKGKRAGFKFEDGGTAYHCFNCGDGMNTTYDPTKHTSMPDKMEKVLVSFGVPETEWQAVLLSSLAVRESGTQKEQVKPRVSIEPDEIPLPSCFYPLAKAPPEDKWAIIANHYLAYNRGIDPSSYPFYLSKKSDDPRLTKWFGRVIIPMYKKNKLIFYVGRDLTGKKLKKYESPAISRQKVIYGFDRLFENRDLPLYIVEGWFDAFAIDGAALIMNSIAEAQAEWLNRSPRQKVYIPDRFGNGRQAAEQALDLGWNISTPDIGDCKDMSEAVQRYGKLYVIKSIVDNTAAGFEARTKLGVFCKWEPKGQPKKN